MDHESGSPEVLKEKIGSDTWLCDEYIQVLVKAGKPKEAIDLYVQKQKYDQAFAFGEAHNQLTELLTIYLDNYKNTTSEKDRHTFKTYAIQLMQSKEARN